MLHYLPDTQDIPDEMKNGVKWILSQHSQARQKHGEDSKAIQAGQREDFVSSAQI